MEEFEVVGAVPDSVAKHVDGAALVDLALETGEELAAGRAVLVETEGGGGVGFGGVEEGAELDEVDAVLAVVVVVVAGGPADAAVAGRRFADGAAGGGVAGVAGEGLADEAFEACFGGVGGHGVRAARLSNGVGGSRSNSSFNGPSPFASVCASCSRTARTCRSSTPGNHSTNCSTVAPLARFS